MPTLAADGTWVCDLCTAGYQSETAADRCEGDCYAGWRAGARARHHHTYQTLDLDPED